MIDSPSQQLLNKINQIYFHKFNNDERNVIYKLIIDWSEIIDINQSIITFR